MYFFLLDGAKLNKDIYFALVYSMYIVGPRWLLEAYTIYIIQSIIYRLAMDRLFLASKEIDYSQTKALKQMIILKTTLLVSQAFNPVNSWWGIIEAWSNMGFCLLLTVYHCWKSTDLLFTLFQGTGTVREQVFWTQLLWNRCGKEQTIVWATLDFVLTESISTIFEATIDSTHDWCIGTHWGASTPKP